MKKWFKDKFSEEATDKRLKAKKRRKKLNFRTDALVGETGIPVLPAAGAGGLFGAIVLLEPNVLLFASSLCIYAVGKDGYDSYKKVEWKNKSGQTLTSSVALKYYLEKTEAELKSLKDTVKISSELAEEADNEVKKSRYIVSGDESTIKFNALLAEAKELATEVTMKKSNENYKFKHDLIVIKKAKNKKFDGSKFSV